MHVGKSSIENRLVPIPPLVIQAEIVRILDAFTALTAELTAELTAREKQYTYYRDQLLTRLLQYINKGIHENREK